VVVKEAAALSQSGSAAFGPAASPTRVRPRLRWGRLRAVVSGSAVLGALSIIGGLLLWQVLSALEVIDPLFFSTPIDVAREGAKLLQDDGFWSSISTSGHEFVVGYGLAVVTAVPLGLLIGWYRRLSVLFSPWLSFFYALPRIALLPIVILWLGLGTPSVIAIVYLGAFFSIILNVAEGARVVDQRLLTVARSFSASEPKVFASVVIPSSVPFMVVGLRLGIARALIGVIIGELYGGGEGLGRTIYLASNSLNASRVLFVTLFVVTVAMLLTTLLNLVDRRVSAWRGNPT
jgi:NitT/TauT family transport system permease protein